VLKDRPGSKGREREVGAVPENRVSEISAIPEDGARKIGLLAEDCVRKSRARQAISGLPPIQEVVLVVKRKFAKSTANKSSIVAEVEPRKINVALVWLVEMDTFERNTDCRICFAPFIPGVLAASSK
jgi:hypothetical protein